MFGLNPGAACSFNPPFFSLTVDINNEMKDELKKMENLVECFMSFSFEIQSN
jgi:hypothetical protein